jgi:ribosome-associated toxin RatA of RatAB toxin-antitoxin module
MYALVDNVEAYPQFLPWCRAVRVLERSAQRTVATLAVGMRGLRYEFTTQNENRPHEAIDLALIKGPFRHFAAHWRFSALGERAARIDFAMEYEFAGALVSRALGPLFETIADTMVDAFKRRADAVYGPAAR